MVFAHAESLKLTLPTSGAYTIWNPSGPVGSPPADAVHVNGPKATVNLESGNIAIKDESTGNLALVPSKSLEKNGNLLAGTFTMAAEADLTVEAGGKPVGAADVNLAAGSTQQHQLLTPEKQGTLKFYGVPIGDITISVDLGDGSAPTKQIFTIKRDRPDPIPLFKVACATANAAASPAGTTSDAGGNPNPSPDAANSAPNATHATQAQPMTILGRIITLVLGIAVIGALLFGLIYVLKNGGPNFQAKLQNLGVPIGDAVIEKGAADPAVMQPVDIAPQKQSQIMLENSEPVALANPIGFTPAATTTLTEPVWVREDTGETLLIPGDAADVGRDPAASIALPNESSLSRKHAKISKIAGVWHVEDAGSTNGTFVNGQKITGDVALSVGDRVQFGNVRYRIQGS